MQAMAECQWRGTAKTASGSNAGAEFAPHHSHQHLASPDLRASEDVGEALV